MRTFVLFLVVLAACENGPWPVGTEMHSAAPHAATEAEVAEWHRYVALSVDGWQYFMGEDCPFPFVLLDAPSASSRAITLVPNDQWDDEDAIGHYWEDGGIDIRQRKSLNTMLGTLMHELGHAMSGGWHSDTPGEIMYTVDGQVTRNDAQRMRDAVGCDGPPPDLF
jgi:predicted Zn-dependent protease